MFESDLTRFIHLHLKKCKNILKNKEVLVQQLKTWGQRIKPVIIPINDFIVIDRIKDNFFITINDDYANRRKFDYDGVFDWFDNNYAFSKIDRMEIIDFVNQPSQN